MGLYHDNKDARVGSQIECPVCHKKFKKVQYSQAFCSLECKDRFWNANRGSVSKHERIKAKEIVLGKILYPSDWPDLDKREIVAAIYKEVERQMENHAEKLSECGFYDIIERLSREIASLEIKKK